MPIASKMLRQQITVIYHQLYYHEIKDNPNRKGVNNHTCIDIFEKFKFLQLASIANLSPSNHIVFLLNFVPVIHHCNGNAMTILSSHHQK